MHTDEDKVCTELKYCLFRVIKSRGGSFGLQNKDPVKVTVADKSRW